MVISRRMLKSLKGRSSAPSRGVSADGACSASPRFRSRYWATCLYGNVLLIPRLLNLKQGPRERVLLSCWKSPPKPGIERNANPAWVWVLLQWLIPKMLNLIPLFKPLQMQLLSAFGCLRHQREVQKRGDLLPSVKQHEGCGWLISVLLENPSFRSSGRRQALTYHLSGALRASGEEKSSRGGGERRAPGLARGQDRGLGGLGCPPCSPPHDTPYFRQGWGLSCHPGGRSFLF